MIKCILWDIDATVLNFEIAESKALKSAFEKLKLGKCDDKTVRRYSEINQNYWKMLERGIVTKQQVLLNRFVDFLQIENITDVDARTMCKAYEEGLSEVVVFNDNSYDLLNELKYSYYQCAVTNGASSIQKKKMKKSGLDKIFDSVFISDEIGAEKPNVKFFDFVLKSLSDFKKEEILIVGDSLTSDITGGNNAGIKCCWYNPKNAENNEKVKIDFEIHNLNEIKHILKSN